MKDNHTEIVLVVGMALLLRTSLALGADGQGSSPGGNSPPVSQEKGREAARHTGCQSQGEADKVTSQRPCIVDLKPGDVRLFEPSEATTGKLARWLELQAASIGTQYTFAKNGLGVTTANQQQYQVAVRGRFKLDAKGRFSINTGLYTGANFSAGSIIPEPA